MSNPTGAKRNPVRKADKGEKGRTKIKTRALTRQSEQDAFGAYNEEEEKPTLAFKVINAEQTKELSEIEDVDQLEAKIAEVMNIIEYVTDLKAATVLDYYVAAFWWAKEQNFNVEQVSAFFTVVHTLLENIKEKTLTLLDNLKEFRKMLVGVGLPPPLPVQPEQESAQTLADEPSSTEAAVTVPTHVVVLDCFNVTQAKAVTDYVHGSIFKHYKLYEYMFSHTQAEELIGADVTETFSTNKPIVDDRSLTSMVINLEVEVPRSADMPWPPPLEEGLSDDIYHTYIDIQLPVSPSQQTADDRVPSVTGIEGTEFEGADDQIMLEEQPSIEVLTDILSQLSAAQIKNIMNSVFDVMLGDMKDDIVSKLREKENGFINRINKVHQSVQSPDKQ